MLVPETEIIITRDGAELARTTVRPGDYVIGSDAASEISIAAEGVAERHAQLTVNYHELFIEDLGSGSGTFVGGQPVTESTRLWPTQKVQIGSVVLETRKVKSLVDSSVSLAPDAATVRRVLPEEFLRARKYEIGGLIAQGGMGAVLDAHEATTQRTVAMKVMLASMSEGDVLRFIEEAQITSQLEHPNIVPVHELGVDEHDQVFYTMKLVQGVTLRQVLEKLRAGDAATVAAYPLRRLLIVLMRVCDALAFAHSRGVIHRDLKPDNVMIGDFGEVLVMDWGLAKVLGTTRAVAAPESATDSAIRRVASLSGSVRSVRQDEGTEFTMAGSIVGTPHYMSPEQARGESETLEEGTDIWALGAILRHILTLEKPVPGETVDDVIENVRAGRLTPIPPRAAHCPGGRVPDALAAVMAKAQALRREDRYASVTQFREEIDAWLGGFATKAEQAGLVKQLALLIQRHKGIFSTAAAAWLLITALAVWFVFNLRAKEQRAVAGEQKATAAEAVAKDAEAVAVQEKETARQALAKSQLDLAEKEFERGKFVEAQKILGETPESFRDANWRFLQAHSRDFTSEIPPGATRLRFLARGDRFVAKQYVGKLGVFALDGQQIGSWIECPRTADESIAIDTAGTRIAFSPAPKEIVVQEIATGNLLSRWTIEGDQVHRLVMSPDGETVLAESGGRLTAYDTPTGKIRWTQPSAGARSTFTSDGQMVAVLTSKAGLSLTVLIVEAQSGSVLKTLDALADNPEKSALQFNQAGDLLACLGGDEVILWNPRTAKRIRALHFPGEKVMGLSPTGEVLATTFGNRIHLRETATGRLLRSLNGAESAFVDVAFSPDGRILLSAHKYGKVKVWPIRLDEETARARPSTGAGAGVAFDIKGSSFYAIADKNLGSWESGSGLQKWTHRAEATYRFFHLEIHPTDGSILLSILGTNKLLRMSSQGAVLESIVCKRSPVSRFELSSDGRFVAIAGKPCRVLAYPSGQELREFTLRGLRGQPMVAFCLDDTSVAIAGVPNATGESGGGITVWDWKANRLLYQIDPTSTGSINGMVASPDGRFLASCGPDRWIRIWEAATGELKSAFRADWEEVHCVKFSADGREVLSGSALGTVRIHKAFSGEEVLAFYGLTDPVRDVDFSPDGDHIAAISETGMTKVWSRSLSSAAALLPNAAPANEPLAAANPAAKEGPPTALKPALPKKPKPVLPKDADGWEDLLAPLTPAEVAETGHGWSLKDGELFSPDTKGHTTLPLPSEVAGTNYQLRVRLRQRSTKNVLHLIIPVADRMTGFDLDGFPQGGFYTGLRRVNGKAGKDLPGIVKGEQVKDTKPHDLEVTVRLDGANATITATLDGKPLYEWTGPTAALSQAKEWATTRPGALALGTYSGGWAVSEVKLKRLEAGK